MPLDEVTRSEEHTSELQSRENLVCRLLLEKKIFTLVLESVLRSSVIIFCFFHVLTWAFGYIIIAVLFFPILILFCFVFFFKLRGPPGIPPFSPTRRSPD